MRLARIGREVVDLLHLARQDRLPAAVHDHALRLPSELEERLHRFRQHRIGIGGAQAVRRAEPCPVEDGEEDPPRADRRVRRAGRDAGADEHQRHVHRGLVEQVAVLRLAVVAEPFAVIRDDGDRARLGDVARERRDEASELRVHRRDLTKVRVARVARAVRLRRLVRRVRIVVVDPEEERRLPRGGSSSASAASVVSRDDRSTAPAGKLVVIDVETACQAEPARERERRDERRGAVAGGVEALGEERRLVRQAAAVLVNAVAGRIEAGHHRGVRRQRLGDGCVGLREAAPARGERVERGRLDPFRVGPDRVGARRVQRDEEDRRPPTRAGRGCLLDVEDGAPPPQAVRSRTAAHAIARAKESVTVRRMAGIPELRLSLGGS